ncbi:MAG: hypothetical protein EP349_01230 [Alphaproteobacteria bacterium]|nr:MAG: hypothetical protein EP349_01230 [Alphaproteobacteria bacterium]
MLAALKSILCPRRPEPSGPPEELRQFTTRDPLLQQSGIASTADGWEITIDDAASLPLFELPLEGIDSAVLTYHAELKAENLDGQAYLEMWCRLPGRGEFFSKGLNAPVTGTTDWISCETPFLLKEGQKPDLLKLNVAATGKGKVFIRNIRVSKTPMA